MCATLRTINASESQHLKRANGAWSSSWQLYTSVFTGGALRLGGDCGLQKQLCCIRYERLMSEESHLEAVVNSLSLLLTRIQFSALGLETAGAADAFVISESEV